MRASLLVLTVVGLAASSCGGAETTVPVTPQEERITPQEERTADVYATAVRRLVTRDTTFAPGQAPFRRIFLRDGAVPRAGDPEASPGQAAPFSPSLKARLRARLSGVLPVDFVDDPDSVWAGSAVRDGGVLITLGPIAGGGDRVTVGASLVFANLGGAWLTYVVERAGGRWAVTGKTGPAAIS